MALRDFNAQATSGVTGTSNSLFNKWMGPYNGNTGVSDSQGFCLALVYDDITQAVESYIFDPGGASEVIGTQIAEYIDTDLGQKGEIWYIGELVSPRDIGHIVVTYTKSMTGIVHQQQQRYIRSTTNELIGPHETDTIIEQTSGLVGAELVTAKTTNMYGIQVLSSNETSPANWSPETGWGASGDYDSAVMTSGTYANIVTSYYNSSATDWGYDVMTVGGGSAAVVVLSEGGELPDPPAGGAGGGSKAPLMQWPLGSGNWLMNNGILTR